MAWIKAFHIIAMVAWFAGLFYLPRLFVYHASSLDKISCERFKIMEWRLYYMITWPAGLLTTLCGYVLLYLKWDKYRQYGWMLMKLKLIPVLWLFHILCGHYLLQFSKDRNQRSS